VVRLALNDVGKRESSKIFFVQAYMVSPSNIIFGSAVRAVMPYGWAGNRRSGVCVADLSGFYTYGFTA